MIGIDIQFNIISYAVISSKFETNSNLLDSFLPLVEHALLLTENDYIKEIEINDKYEEIYGYRIHSAILSQILKILQQQGKIERLKQETIQINKLKLSSCDINDEYNKNLRFLVSEISLFLKRQGVDASKKEIENSIISFLRKNAMDFNSFINYNCDLEDANNEENPIFEYLVEFLLQERRNNTNHYKFIKDVYLGIVLSSIIISGDDTVAAVNSKFKNINVLLDSNYIFRLLDLQTSLEYQAAQDTYKALLECDCKFHVCRETLKQIADTIHALTTNVSFSSNSILKKYGEDKFTGLAAACIRRGLTAAKLESIIDGLEETLINDYNVEFFDDESYNTGMIDINSEDFNQLSRVKEQASDFGIAHDLLLIKIVSELRPRSMYKAEQANWWVLTDDNKLTRWNSSSKGSSGVPECITESQLATVMWICNPKKATLDGLFNTVIALKSQGLVGNAEYAKISRIIDEQKDRLKDDQRSFEKLSMVFSNRLLNIDEVLDKDSEEVNAEFDRLLLDSDKKVHETEQLLKEKDRCIAEQTEKSTELITQINHTKSLLSQKSEKYIESLKIRIADKNQLCMSKKDELTKVKNKRKSEVKIISVFLRILCVALVVVVFLFLLPLIKALEAWYASNQFFVYIAAGIFAVASSLLGFKNETIIQGFGNIAEKILVLLFKCKMFRNLDDEANALKNDYKELLDEISNLQDEIDKELNL